MTRRFHTLAILLLVACDQDVPSQPRSPLLTSPGTSAPAAVDVGRAARDVSELSRALATRLPGAHRIQTTAKTQLLEGSQVLEELGEESLLELAGDGAYHARYSNSKQYGREVFWSGGTLWLRPLYGMFHRRAPVAPDEPARLAAEIAGTLAAQVELVAPAVALADGGRADAAGRTGRKVLLRLAGAQAAGGAAAWRKDARVREVEGEVILDAKSGAVLAGKLRAKVAFTREGRNLEMVIESSETVSDAGGTVAVAPPSEADSVATPLRGTEFDEREELLSGIAPPAQRAPTPAPTK